MQPTVVSNYIIKAKQSAGVVATVLDNLTSTSAADALSANQGKILNDKIELSKNIITAWGTTNQVITAGNTINLSNYNSVGGLLTLNNNAIVIGTGISKVKVSANIFLQDFAHGSGYMFPRITKNGNNIGGSISPTRCKWHCRLLLDTNNRENNRCNYWRLNYTKI